MTTSWQDFPTGRELSTAAVTVTETHVVGWASLTGDWYPLHMDAVSASRSEFGQRIVHGPFTYALAIGLLAQTGEYGTAIRAWLGTRDLRALQPVLIGDTVRCQATVGGSRPSESQPGCGVVTLNCQVLNQDDAPVLQFDFTLLMHGPETAT